VLFSLARLRAGRVISGGNDVKKEQKETIVAELADRLKAADTVLVADYRGLTMPQIDTLRTRLLESGARFTVVKNTLTRRAAEAAGADALLTLLEGPTAIAFLEADGDMLAAAKALADMARESKVLAIRGGVLQGRVVTAEEVETLAALPPIEILRGQVLGAIIAPVTALLGLVTAPLQNLYGLLDARIEQLGGEEVAPEAAEPEPEVEAAAEPEPAAEAEPAAEEVTEATATAVASEEETTTEEEES
jgi:large subunit ribosomal protein L10